MQTGFATVLILVAFLLTRVSADEPGAPRPKATIGMPKLPPGFAIEKMGDPKEASKAADWVEKEYAGKPTEAAKMLIAILRGLKADGSDGWFGPAESRYSWEWLVKRSELEAKVTAISREQFKGPAALFDRLDRDGDGKLTPSDLDWSDRNPYVQQAAMITRLFRRMDGNTDGELTREELEAFFKRVAGGKDTVTAEDLRNALIPRGPSGFAPGDGPSVPVLVRGLFTGEVGSMSDGPHVGDAAPSFKLGTVDGQDNIQFSKMLGKKPVVLILGNFTCGPFRALYPDLEAIHRRHKKDADFLMVYVREAHPSDGWKMEQNERLGVSVKQPTTLGERTKVAGQFCTKLKPAMPVLVDEIDDRVGNMYSGMPGRLYVIDGNGKVAYKSGRGPFGFRSGEMEQALVMTLLEASEGKQGTIPDMPTRSDLFPAPQSRYTTCMSTITLLELQQQPTAVLDRVQAGERLLIVRDGQAVAELRPAQTAALPLRPRGRCVGMFRVPDDFDAPLPEDLLRGFEGR